MYDLLRWLYSYVDRVYVIIGSLYYKIRDAALYAKSWAISQARNAYYNAISLANIFVANASAVLNNTIEAVKSFLISFVQSNLGPLAASFYTLRASFNLLLSGHKPYIDLIFGPVITKYYEIKDTILTYVNSKIGLIRATLESLAKSVELILQGHEPYLKLILGDKLWNTLIKTDELMGALTIWWSNPLSWFAAYLRSLFMTVLEYALGYALGAVNSNLPPWPDWGGGGYGGPFLPGPGPPPEAGQLAPPLTHLYQSGYGFTPVHQAADFGCTGSMAVYACHDGKVKVSGWSNIGYGNYVVIQDDEWWSLYAHLVNLRVTVNQIVKSRQPIGMCDTTGNSTGNHLHLELKYHGKFINPYIAFGIPER